jgi:hypothetical protein
MGWWYVDDQVFVLYRLCKFPLDIRCELALPS